MKSGSVMSMIGPNVLSPRLELKTTGFTFVSDTEGIDRDIRAAVQGGFHLIDDLFGVDRWRPLAINHVTRERIDGGKGPLDIEQTSDVFTLDQADRSSYAQGDEVILRFRPGQDSYDSTRSLAEGLNSGRYCAVGI